MDYSVLVNIWLFVKAFSNALMRLFSMMFCNSGCIEMEIHLKLSLCWISRESMLLRWNGETFELIWSILRENLCYLAFIVFISFISSVHFYITSLCFHFYDCWECFWWRIIKPCEYKTKKSYNAGKIKEKISFSIVFMNRLTLELIARIHYMWSIMTFHCFSIAKPAELSIQWKCKFY